MDKYELREGETFIEEYIDDDGEHVTIFEDKNGITMHGWVLDLSPDLEKFVKLAAADANMDEQDYTTMIIADAIEKIVEQDERKKFIEEISK